jgi:hypothetical protein
MPERIRLRIGNMGKAVLVSGQSYQDPKDALNEFVSNAADEYAEAGRHAARIRIVLRRRGRYPVIAIEDSGRGMDAERLRRIAGNLFNSSKVSDPKIIGERELADLENPMRTAIGTQPGQGALLREVVEAEDLPSTDDGETGSSEPRRPEVPTIEELVPSAPRPEEVMAEPPAEARPSSGQSRHLPTLLPDPSPDGVRSRFDAEHGVVYYNDRHPDYLLLKSDEQALLDYLSTLVAKEYVVYNNPRAGSDELAEEMVRMLIRVRRHLPRKV